MIFSLILLVSFIGILSPWFIKAFVCTKLEFPVVITCSIIALLLPSIIFVIVIASAFADTEILNGQVTNKDSEKVSCSHSYSCNCRQVSSTSRDSKGNMTTSYHTECDTCYEHFYDVNWNVYTSLGRIEIDRIDRQGLKTPLRWTSVIIGEPVSKNHRYQNYIKGNVDSFFHLTPLKVVYSYPIYPEIYDYYRYNRVINLANLAPTFIIDLNNRLNEALRDLGHHKEVNIIVIFTDIQDVQYGEGLRRHWQNGKKNDIIIVVGVEQNKPTWTKVFSLAQSDIVNIKIRDSINSLTELTDATIFSSLVIRDITENYQRKRMRDFEYLKYNLEIPPWVFIISFLLSSLIGIGGPILVARQSRHF